jgi:hypothetical protein
MAAWDTAGNNAGANAFLGTTSAQPLRIRTNNVEKMSITTDGNVGIGTATPSQKLALGSGNVLLPNTNLGIDGNLYFGGTTDTGQLGMRLFGGRVNPGPNEIHAGFIDVKTDAATDGLRIRIDTGNGATERMRITAGGNVGIGTTGAPAGKLDVRGDIRAGNSDI